MHADVSALNKTGVWHEASRIINEEGLRAFWKGNLVTIVHRLPYSSINFYAYEHYKKVGSIGNPFRCFYCLSSLVLLTSFC